MKKALLTIVFLASSFLIKAQPPDCTNPDDDCYDVCCENYVEDLCNSCVQGTQAVPIDGGVLWLLLGGAAYGVKKIYDRRKK